MPGDPLDKSVRTGKLEMASTMATARDFVMKTRRRKGLSEDVGVGKFLEGEMWRELTEGGVLDG